MKNKVITRLYVKPEMSFFLLGPRGVGKSTWIRNQVKPDFEIDLLSVSESIQLERDPGLLEAKISHLKKGSLIFIDEIQKVPTLLDEVHRLIEKKGYLFVLSGSSARKLRKNGINLLGGRALTMKMFPFSMGEIEKNWSIENALKLGTLPVLFKHLNLADKILYSYVQTYLKEEIKEEALVRNLVDFSRFLEVAGQLNGQILNLENIARDIGRSGPTIQAWFQILVDTLIGNYLEPYRPGLKVRETGHPKFYMFDCGVARACAGLLNEEVDSLWKGYALETLVLNELKIYNEISGKNKSIYFYDSPGAGEIDFIIETKKKTIQSPAEFISIEVKSGKKWKRSFEDSTRSLHQFSKGKLKKMIGIYLGNERLTFDGFEVYPLTLFIRKLMNGEIY